MSTEDDYHPKPDDSFSDKGHAAIREALDRLRDERDAAVARAVRAESRPASAVSRADIEKAILSCPRFGAWDGVRVAASAATDAVWALVSGADPAVHVVRESDLPTVSRGEDEHWRDEDGKYVVWGTHTLESVKANVKIQLRHAAEFEAVARAIEAEQAADPVEEKAIELHQVAYGGRIGFGHATLNAQEMFRSLARHVLGQEADDE